MYSMNTAYDHSGKRELGAMHSNPWTAHKLNSTLMNIFHQSSYLFFGSIRIEFAQVAR